MRLIDADELKNKLFIAEDNWNPIVTEKEIDEQPTAYDVEKVVEQLGKESYQEFCDSPKIVDLEDAIKIVRGGRESRMTLIEIKEVILRCKNKVNLKVYSNDFAKGYCYGVLNTSNKINTDEYNKLAKMIDDVFDSEV